jgi:hypothetical protein
MLAQQLLQAQQLQLAGTPYGTPVSVGLHPGAYAVPATGVPAPSAGVVSTAVSSLGGAGASEALGREQAERVDAARRQAQEKADRDRLQVSSAWGTAAVAPVERPQSIAAVQRSQALEAPPTVAPASVAPGPAQVAATTATAPTAGAGAPAPAPALAVGAAPAAPTPAPAPAPEPRSRVVAQPTAQPASGRSLLDIQAEEATRKQGGMKAVKAAAAAAVVAAPASTSAPSLTTAGPASQAGAAPAAPTPSSATSKGKESATEAASSAWGGVSAAKASATQKQSLVSIQVRRGARAGGGLPVWGPGLLRTGRAFVAVGGVCACVRVRWRPPERGGAARSLGC